ncbi:MAG: class I SAM-dependent methyltransferase [Chitinophagales bacterium]
MSTVNDPWNEGELYTRYMGRWSSLAAEQFLRWLQMPAHLDWLDLGCGAGALSVAISRRNDPRKLYCIDPSAAFLEKTQKMLDMQATYAVGDAEHIPFADDNFDVVVSGLAMNFFPSMQAALQEICRATKPGGTIAAYIWDYAGVMDMLRIFWSAVIELDPAAKKLDEAVRFAQYTPAFLRQHFLQAKLEHIETGFMEIETVFQDMEDYWSPFLSGQGPAPGYVASLNENNRERLFRHLQNKLPIQRDGSLHLKARAIAIAGKCPL